MKCLKSGEVPPRGNPFEPEEEMKPIIEDQTMPYEN